MEGRGTPVEITMQEFEEDDGVWSSSVFALQFGDRQIEVTTVLCGDANAARWVRDVQRAHRERLRGGAAAIPGGDLVVGLCTFRRKPWLLRKGTAAAAKGAGDHPIVAMSLCAGGTDKCLVVALDDNEHGRSASRRRPLPRALADFLADRNTRFVGIGARSAAERLERVWRIHVAKAAELRPLVAAAFGRHAVPPPKRGGGDGDGLREMARAALGGLNAGKKPTSVESRNWSFLVDFDDETIMYAAVDAFLSCEVAEACLKLLAIS